MRKLFARIGDEIRHARAVYADHAELMQANDDFDDLLDRTDSSPYQAEILAVLIGALYDSQADHLVASRLARATTALPSPDTLRIRAAEWRARAEQIRFADNVRARISRLNEDDEAGGQ